MSDKTSAARRKELGVLAARLRAIELRDQVDTAVAISRDEQELLVNLAQPPLNFSGIAATAVLSMRVRDRSPHAAARLLAEIETLQKALDDASD